MFQKCKKAIRSFLLRKLAGNRVVIINYTVPSKLTNPGD